MFVPLHYFSSLSDETLNWVPSPYGLAVGGMLKPSSLTHSFALILKIYALVGNVKMIW